MRTRKWKTDGEYARDSDLRRKYGVSLADVKRMYDAQNGRCAICRIEVPLVGHRARHGISLDHCHKSKVARKLLCQPCNRGLAYLENADWLKSAVAYLRSFESVPRPSFVRTLEPGDARITSGRLYRHQNSIFWWISYWRDGKRYRTSSRTVDQTLAQERLNSLLDQSVTALVKAS